MKFIESLYQELYHLSYLRAVRKKEQVFPKGINIYHILIAQASKATALFLRFQQIKHRTWTPEILFLFLERRSHRSPVILPQYHPYVFLLHNKTLWILPRFAARFFQFHQGTLQIEHTSVKHEKKHCQHRYYTLVSVQSWQTFSSSIFYSDYF